MDINKDIITIIEHFYPHDDQLRGILLEHSKLVAEKALAIADDLPEGFVDKDIVKNGALLHDIGIIKCHAPGIFCFGEADYIAHGTLGAEMLRNYAKEYGIDLEIYARICENHTGSGISAAEVVAQKLPLKVKDYLPVTNEEKLIALADKFFSKSGSMQEKPLWKIRRSLEKFGVDCVRRFDDMCGLFGVNDEN